MNRCVNVCLGVMVVIGMGAGRGFGMESNQAPDRVLPEMTISVCQQAPVVDGALTDACWQTAAALTNFNLFGKSGEFRAQQAWVARDDQWLYLAFAVRHPQPDKIKALVQEPDGGVTADDSVEVFIQPGGEESKGYFHFMLNAANTRAEQRCITNGGRDRHWGIPWRSAVAMTATGWNAELALPLCLLGSYGDLAKTRLNLCINIMTPIYDRQAVKVDENEEGLTWAPVIGGFHDPAHFGFLKGIQPASVRAPVLPYIRKASVGGYVMTNGHNFFPVTVELQNLSATTGSIQLVVADRPFSGKEREETRAVALESVSLRTEQIMAPAETLAERTVQVLMRDIRSGEILQRVHVADTAMLRLMSAWLDRSYYTTEKEALAIVRLSLPEGALAGMQVMARTSQGQALAQTNAASNTRLAIPIGSLPVGSNPISIGLCRADGARMFAQPVALTKRPPKPGCEWKIDTLNGVVLDNGKPFFPFGVSCEVYGQATERWFKEMADIGFNTVWHYNWRQEPESARTYCETAAKYNLNVALNLEGFSVKPLVYQKLLGKTAEENTRLFQEGYEKEKTRILAAVSNAMACPNLMAYVTFDEPLDAVLCDMCGPGLDLYRRTNEADGYHPTYVVYSSYIPAGDRYTDWCDILGTDPYWVPAEGGGARGFVNFVSEITRTTKRRADARHKVTWIVPQSEYWSGIHKRGILPQEQFCQTYLALIHGAKGLAYYPYPLIHQWSYEALKQVASELKTLGPMLTTPDVPQAVTYTPGDFDMDQGRFPDVQVALHQNPAGGYVLLAANSKNYPVDVTCTLSCLAGQGKVGRLFAKDEYPVKDGAFSDHLEALGVRAYEIRGQKSEVSLPADVSSVALAKGEALAKAGSQNNQSTALVQIAVAMNTHPDQAKLEKVESKQGRVGKKNVIPNPSFEEATLPNWPDYYLLGCVGRIEARLNTPEAEFVLDPTNAFHGRVSVRMTQRNPGPQGGGLFDVHGRGRGWNQVVCNLVLPLEKPTEYVISAWMRADRDGMQCNFVAFGTSKLAPLTREWQRYSESGTVLPGKQYGDLFGVRTYGEGNVWIDALQLEKGSVPTEFEP